MEAAMLELKSDDPASADYAQDLVLWYQQQMDLLKARRFDQVDLENLIEELQSAMNKERRELSSRLEVLLMHLLKCQFQHQRISRGWLGTLGEQRSEISKLLRSSPSLRRTVPQVVEEVYADAVSRAALETRLPRASFPIVNPYSLDQLFDRDFVP
jgi:hypothetical protein